MRRCRARSFALGLLVAAALVLAAGFATRVLHNLWASSLATPLHVRMAGQAGGAVLLLHGLVGSSAYWKGVAAVLQPEFRLIIPDLLGFGSSPWPAVDYSVDDHLRALEATIRQVAGPTRLSVVAHSMGTQLAVAFALRFPDRVDRLLLIGPPLFASRERALEAARRSSPILSIMSLHPLLAPIVCAIHEATRPLLNLALPFWLSELPPEVARDAGQHTWDSFTGSLEQVVLGTPLGTLLPQVLGVPILILQGDRDENADPEELLRLARSVGGEFVQLPGDHNFILTHPEPAISIIRRFLVQ